MFEFLQTAEKKSAFKKALNEITHERPEPIAFNEKKASEANVSRPYSSSIKNPLRKPETTAVDLKNFKDWRHVEKVKSNNPVYKQPTRAKQDEDEDVGTFPGQKTFAKSNPITSSEIIDRFAALPREEKTDKDFISYIMSEEERKVSTVRNKTTLQELINRFDETQPQKTEQKVLKHARTAEEIKAEFEREQKPKILAQPSEPAPEKPQVKSEPTNQKLKVEVIDFSKPKAPVKKPATNRKPRGKSKRRFDADVISSIDWK